MERQFRRVVTEIDGNGHSVIASEGPPPLVIHPRHPDQDLTLVWSVRSVPASYAEHGDLDRFRLQPTERGLHIVRNTLPPDTTLYQDEQGRARAPARDEFLHRTRTVDFVQVLDGTLTLVLEDGTEVRLDAGDCVVQRGTVHAWRNHTAHPVAYLVVLIAGDESTLPASPVGTDALA